MKTRQMELSQCHWFLKEGGRKSEIDRGGYVVIEAEVREITFLKAEGRSKPRS